MIGRTVDRQRGQGTLEYVLIFVLIALVLLVVGYLMRGQIIKLANDARARFTTMGKDQASQGKKDSSAPKYDPEENPYKKKSGASKGSKAGGGDKDDEKDKGKLKVDKPVDDAAPTPDEEPQFSLSNKMTRQIILIGGAIAIAFGVFFIFKQAKQ